MQGNIGSWAVLLLLAAFAIERIVAAASFLLGPKPEDARALLRREVLLFGLAAAVALAIVDGSNEIRLLKNLQPGRHGTPYDCDFWLTWLVLVAGSDHVRSVVQWMSGAVAAAKEAKPDVPPVRIVVDDGVSVKAVA